MTLSWMFLAAAVAAALGLLWVKSEGLRRRAAPAAAGPPFVPEPPPEPAFSEFHLDGVPLPSSLPDYDFLLSATVWWRPAGHEVEASAGNQAGHAAAAVLSRAENLSRREHPQRFAAAQYRLEGALSSLVPDDSGTLMYMVRDVRLTLAAEDRGRLAKLAGLRKDEEAWEQERHFERHRRTYLAEDVLQSPGSAAVWWLARHEEEVEETVRLLGPLAQLSAAAHDREVSELFRHLVESPDNGRGPALDDGGTDDVSPPAGSEGAAGYRPDEGVASRALQFLEGCGFVAGTPEHTTFVNRLTGLLRISDREDQAERVHRHFFPEEPDSTAGPLHDGPVSSQPT